MTRRDPLALLGAAYSFASDDQAWLAGIVDALVPYDIGGGIAAYISTFGPTSALRAVENRSRQPTAELHRLVERLPPALYQVLHAPMPVTSALDLFPRAAAAFGIPFERGGGPESPFPEPRNAFAIAGGDATLETVLVVFHCEADDAFSARDRAVLDCFGAHLGSALRLRSLARAPNADDPAVEAVFSPDGRVLDARGAVRAEAERAPLLDAVLRSEHARLRGATPEERLDVWTALVEGRWSILESVERDGKRTLLACRNDPRTVPLRALTERERAVVSCAAVGHAYKYIAYELGLSVPTVAATLTAALRKLGVPSRAELVGMFARGELPIEPPVEAEPVQREN